MHLANCCLIFLHIITWWRVKIFALSNAGWVSTSRTGVGLTLNGMFRLSCPDAPARPSCQTLIYSGKMDQNRRTWNGHNRSQPNPEIRSERWRLTLYLSSPMLTARMCGATLVCSTNKQNSEFRDFWVSITIDGKLTTRVIMVDTEPVTTFRWHHVCISTMFPNCSEISVQFSTVHAESCRQWNGQIVVTKY